MNSLDPRAERDRSSVRTGLCFCRCICVNGTPVNRLLPNSGSRLLLVPLIFNIKAPWACSPLYGLTLRRPSTASLLDAYSIIYKRHRSSESTILCLLRARNVLKPSLVPLYSALLVRVSFIPPAAAPIFCFVVPAVVVSLISLVLPPHPQFAILSLSLLHLLPTA